MKDELTTLHCDIKRISNDVRTALLSIKARTDIGQKNEDSAALRIQRSQHRTLWLRYSAAMQSYADAQSAYNEKCKSRLRRQLEISGIQVDEQDIAEMVESSDKHQTGIFSSLIKDNLQAQQALVDMQIRNDEIQNLESGITELRDVFLDVSMLVAEQGDTVNSISGYIADASVSVEHGKKDLKTALTYRGRSRKKKVVLIVVGSIGIAVVIIVVVLVLVCVVLKKCGRD